jgi:hypothetical protein
MVVGTLMQNTLYARGTCSGSSETSELWVFGVLRHKLQKGRRSKPMVGLREFETSELQVFGVLRCKLQKGQRPEPHGRNLGFGL